MPWMNKNFKVGGSSHLPEVKNEEVRQEMGSKAKATKWDFLGQFGRVVYFLLAGLQM